MCRSTILYRSIHTSIHTCIQALESVLFLLLIPPFPLPFSAGGKNRLGLGAKSTPFGLGQNQCSATWDCFAYGNIIQKVKYKGFVYRGAAGRVRQGPSLMLQSRPFRASLCPCRSVEMKYRVKKMKAQGSKKGTGRIIPMECL